MIFSDLWNSLLYIPILNSLVFFYHLLWGNFGLSIIAITLVIKVLTYPLSKPALNSQKKMKELQPEIANLKKKYKNTQVFAQKQMELYKKHGINPASGCISQIIPFIVVIALYRVFTNLLSQNGSSVMLLNEKLYNFDYLKFLPGEVLNTKFLYLNLANPDPYYLLPVLAAASQFFMSKYMMAGSKKLEPTIKNTPDKKDDLMYNMQEQMTYLFPIMTLVIGVSLPSGLVLFWFISTLLAVVQYKFIGLGSQKAK